MYFSCTSVCRVFIIERGGRWSEAINDNISITFGGFSDPFLGLLPPKDWWYHINPTPPPSRNIEVRIEKGTYSNDSVLGRGHQIGHRSYAGYTDHHANFRTTGFSKYYLDLENILLAIWDVFLYLCLSPCWLWQQSYNAVPMWPMCTQIVFFLDVGLHRSIFSLPSSVLTILVAAERRIPVFLPSLLSLFASLSSNITRTINIYLYTKCLCIALVIWWWYEKVPVRNLIAYPHGFA